MGIFNLFGKKEKQALKGYFSLQISNIEKLNSKRVYDLINISNLRFGAEFSPESFNEYLGRKNNK